MKKIRTSLLCVVSVFVAALLFSNCGNKKSDFDYDYVAAKMSKGDSWSIIDKDGNVVVEEEYPADSRLSEIHNGVYWVKSGDKYQLYSINDPKKPVIDEEFASVTLFYSEYAVVSNPNQQIRIIDTKGKTITTLGKEIKRCYTISNEGYAKFVGQDKKYGIIDSKGSVVVKPIYSFIYSCKDGVVLAQKNDEDKVIMIMNMKGEKLGEIDSEKYDRMSSEFSEEKIVVKAAGEEASPYVILDKSGKKLFEIKKSQTKYVTSYYLDGYLVFENEDAKYGVADDKGAIVIRPKYDYIKNIGNGLFFAKKGVKFGVIDTEDNAKIDFDYDDGLVRMGDNFLVVDGKSYSLINKEGKEIASFDEVDGQIFQYVDYVDMEGLSTSVINTIAEFEKALPISQAVKTVFMGLDIDNARYTRVLTHKDHIDEKVQYELELMYDEYLAEEKTHVEKVNDGWFTYERKVSDGWNWSNAIPQNISGTISLSYGTGLNIKDLYKTLMTKLSEGRMKISDTKYSKTVKTRNETVECQTELTLNDENIDIEMVFRR